MKFTLISSNSIFSLHFIVCAVWWKRDIFMLLTVIELDWVIDTIKRLLMYTFFTLSSDNNNFFLFDICTYNIKHSYLAFYMWHVPSHSLDTVQTMSRENYNNLSQSIHIIDSRSSHCVHIYIYFHVYSNFSVFRKKHVAILSSILELFITPMRIEA